MHELESVVSIHATGPWYCYGWGSYVICIFPSNLAVSLNQLISWQTHINLFGTGELAPSTTIFFRDLHAFFLIQKFFKILKKIFGTKWCRFPKHFPVMVPGAFGSAYTPGAFGLE